MSVAVSGSWADGSDAAAEAGAVHELVERHHHDQRRDDHEHLVGADVSAEEGEQHVARWTSRGNASRSRPSAETPRTPEIASDAPMAEISAARRGAPRLRSGR